MIATNRFSSVRLVAGVATAALCCYMASQYVAAERAALARVDRQIAGERDAIAKLTTEITTRSRLTQVESWNRQLALQAPRPAQYVDSGFQLASLYAHDTKPQIAVDPAAVPNQGPIEQAAYHAPVSAPDAPSLAVPKPSIATRTPPAPVKVAPVPVAPATRPAIVMAAFRPAPTSIAPARSKTKSGPAQLLPDAMLHSASFVQPQTSRLDAPAPALDRVGYRPPPPTNLLSSDIADLVKAEQAKRRTRKDGE